MRYRLKFFDSCGQVTRVLDVDAPDEDAAIHLCCVYSIDANTVVELWHSDSFIIRMTPLTAHLYGCDVEPAHAHSP
jgi:hypothetical protein